MNARPMATRHWLANLIISMLLTSIAAGCAHAAGGGYANPTLLTSTERLEDLITQPGIRVVDVRPKAAHDQGHVPGAVHLGADDIVDTNSHVEGDLLPHAEIVAMLEERGIGRDTHVVFYDDKGGFHASRLFWMLEYFGHRKVSLLDGGFPKWQREGRAVSTKSPTIARADFALTPTPRRAATADWLLDRETDGDTVVIDVRPTKLYKAGHIPWARNIPWKQNLNDDGTLKSAGALRAHFAGHGVTPDKTIAVHCQVGKAAAHSYFTLRLLGYPRVRSYDRSWAEWGTADDLPKSTDTKT